jgi:RNA polymerase sigma-70 factor (ECF subfamily)
MARLFVRRLGVPAAEVDDVCQDVFVQMFRYLASFEHRSDLKTWIYKLCLSQAARLRRRAKLRQAIAWILRTQAPPAQTAGHDWSEAEAQRRVHATLALMKEIHRSVFVLYEIEGLSGEEIAQVTGLPHGTVRRRLHDARREFEALVQQQEGTPA